MRHVAILVKRASWYRTVGPVIEAAIEDSELAVTVVLENIVDPHKPGPTLDTVPDRIRGRCQYITCESGEAMARRLASFDAVFSLVGRCLAVGEDHVNGLPLWCVVYDARHSQLTASRFDDADLIFWPASHQFDEAIRRQVASPEHLAERSCFVGFVRSDSLKLSDRATTLRTCGLDPDHPVIGYIPDSYRFHSDNYEMVTPWYRHVWCVGSPAERAVRAAVRGRSLAAIREALHEPAGERRVLETLRAFCDSNKAQLLLLPRRVKNRVGGMRFSRDEMSVADAVLALDSEYPLPLLTAMQAVDLAVCVYPSHCVIEAAAAGTPYVTALIPEKAYPHWPELEMYEDYVNSYGNHPGLVWSVSAESFIRDFGSRSLDDYRADGDALKSFRERYVGPVDGRVCTRILAETKARLADGDSVDNRSADRFGQPLVDPSGDVGRDIARR